jgi:uncharacterized membrane protein YdcZ (DUF606 family)
LPRRLVRHVAVCATIAGQMIGSLLANTFRWFGVNKVPLDLLRLVGIGLLPVGVLLVQIKQIPPSETEIHRVAS